MGRCKREIKVESIFTLQPHNTVSNILFVDVLRDPFQFRSRRVKILPLRRHGLFLWTVLHRFRMCAAPSAHETQLLHSRSGFWFMRFIFSIFPWSGITHVLNIRFLSVAAVLLLGLLDCPHLQDRSS